MFSTRLISCALLVALAFGSANAISTQGRRLRAPDENDEAPVTEWTPVLMDQREVETGMLTEKVLPTEYYVAIDLAMQETFFGIMNGVVSHASLQLAKNSGEEGNDGNDEYNNDGEIKKWEMEITAQDLEDSMKKNVKALAIYNQWYHMANSPIEPFGVVDETSFRMLVAQYAKDHNKPSLKIYFTRSAEVRMIRFLNFLADQSLSLGRMKVASDERRGRELIFGNKKKKNDPISMILMPFEVFILALTSPFNALCVLLRVLKGDYLGVLTDCKLFPLLTEFMLETGNSTDWDMTFLLGEDFELDAEILEPRSPYVTAADIEYIALDIGFQPGEVPPGALETVADFANNLYALVLEAALRGGVGAINGIAAGFLPQPLLGLLQTATATAQSFALKGIGQIDGGN